MDLRGALLGAGPPVTVTEATEPGDGLYLPAGVAHGFYAPDPVTLLYLVTNPFDGTDELGFRWDDPDAAVPWPDAEPILSGRDRDAPSLAALLAAAAGEPDGAPTATPARMETMVMVLASTTTGPRYFDWRGPSRDLSARAS